MASAFSGEEGGINVLRSSPQCESEEVPSGDASFASDVCEFCRFEEKGETEVGKGSVVFYRRKRRERTRGRSSSEGRKSSAASCSLCGGVSRQLAEVVSVSGGEVSNGAAICSLVLLRRVKAPDDENILCTRMHKDRREVWVWKLLLSSSYIARSLLFALPGAIVVNSARRNTKKLPTGASRLQPPLFCERLRADRVPIGVFWVRLAPLKIVSRVSDLETTGLNTRECGVTEVGAVARVFLDGSWQRIDECFFRLTQPCFEDSEARFLSDCLSDRYGTEGEETLPRCECSSLARTLAAQRSLGSDAFSSLVRCRERVPRVVEALTGISDALLRREGRPLKCVLRNFQRWVVRAALAGVAACSAKLEGSSRRGVDVFFFAHAGNRFDLPVLNYASRRESPQMSAEAVFAQIRRALSSETEFLRAMSAGKERRETLTSTMRKRLDGFEVASEEQDEETLLSGEVDAASALQTPERETSAGLFFVDTLTLAQALLSRRECPAGFSLKSLLERAKRETYQQVAAAALEGQSHRALYDSFSLQTVCASSPFESAFRDERIALCLADALKTSERGNSRRSR